MTKIFRCILVMGLAFSWSFSYAGPPFVTDDPEPVAEGKWEVAYAFSRTKFDGGSSTAIPSIDVNFGLSENIQLHAQPRISIKESGENSKAGVDNTEIGVKYRFYNYQYRNFNFSLGTYPMLQLPTGNQKLGYASGRVQLFLPLWGQVDRDNWTVYGGGGYRENNYQSASNSWFAGLCALYKVSPNLRLGGEVFQETSTAKGESASRSFNLGGIWAIGDYYNLLFSAGKGLNDVQSNRFSSYLALQVTY